MSPSPVVGTAPVERSFGYARDTVPLFVLPGQDGPVDAPNLQSPESKLVGFSEALYGAGINFRDNHLGMLDRWRSNLSWFLHSSDATNTLRSVTDTVINMIFEKVEKLTADMTQTSPSFQYLPQDREDVGFADLMNAASQNIWNRHHMDVELMRTVKASNITGTWYWGTFHDLRYRANGSVEKIVPIPCWNIVPAPYHNEVETAPWMIFLRYRTVGEIQNDYGVAVAAELGTKEVDVQIHDLLRQYPHLHMIQTAQDEVGNPAPEIVPAIPDTFLSNFNRTGIVLQKELWIRDGATTPKYWWDYANGSSKPPTLRYSKTMKYPKGRVISWCNGRLLYDVENPYLDGQFPFAKFTDVSIPDFWYGMGEVEPLVNLQILSDDIWQLIKQILAFTASGRLVIDESTGLEEGDIGNEPGEIWFVNPGTADRIKWHEGSQVHPAMFNLISSIQQGADLISGSHDVTRGINPSGVTAGKALIALQQVANVRIQNRMKEHAKPLSQTARLIASRVQQFWPASKTIRILGKELATEDSLIDVQFRDFVLTEDDRQAAFDVRVVPGVNQEDLKASEFDRAAMLYQMGIMGNEMFVEHAGLTQEKKILRELPVLQAMRQAAGPAPASPGSAAAQAA